MLSTDPNAKTTTNPVSNLIIKKLDKIINLLEDQNQLLYKMYNEDQCDLK